MIKVGGLVEENKCVPCTKYIVSTVSNVSNNSITLNGAELIPIDLDGRLISQSNVSINQELGKQLLKAAADGKVDDLKALLTKGAPFTADWLGTSPLHLAAQNNHLEITEILLRAGISKDARTKVDRTPLHMAAYEGHLQIVETLIKHGADIDCKDLLGMTPLHWAVQNGHLYVMEFLISNGAEVNDCNKFDLTPLMIARQIGRTDIENFLTATIDDSTVAAQNLVIQLSSDDSVVDGTDAQGAIEDMDIEENTTESIIIPIEPNILDQLSQPNDEVDGNSNIRNRIEDEFEEHNSVDVDSTENDGDELEHNINSNNFTDPLRLLHDGITMLQNDENEDNILNSAMESGHSVVLTDVGKEILNSVKQSEQKQKMQQQEQQQQQQLLIEKKIVTVTPEEFLAMTNSALNKKVIKQLKYVPKNQVRRIVMKRTKTLPLPVSTVINMSEPSDKSYVTGTEQNQHKNDMELVMSELIQARKTIEEYKIKLRKKEQETERYKMQLKLLMDPS